MAAGGAKMKYRAKKKRPRAPKRKFIPWQPSTWPPIPDSDAQVLVATMTTIVDETILEEIRNVIADIKARNGDLTHRGHVIAIAMMCALDAVASYGYRGNRGQHIAKFVSRHFPPAYRPHADKLYKFYRNSLIHSWNLFEATLLPGQEPIASHGGMLSFGLLGFFDAFETAVEDFLRALETDMNLQGNTFRRYEKLRATAR